MSSSGRRPTATAVVCDIGDMGVGDVWDNDDAEGAQAEAIAQEDLQVAAAHLGGIMQ